MKKSLCHSRSSGLLALPLYGAGLVGRGYGVPAAGTFGEQSWDSWALVHTSAAVAKQYNLATGRPKSGDVLRLGRQP